MEIPIIFEDEHLVVINKPCGVVVNRAETVKEETVQDWAEKLLNPGQTGVQTEDLEYFLQRGGIVHRLDRETSGLMVVAKTVEAFTGLLAAFKERSVHKEYLALTHGIWKDKFGEITATVGRMRHNRKMMGVREDGRESVTGYRVEEQWDKWVFAKELKVDDRGYTGFSLVRFIPKTGRTHQIRVHAKHMGHPLVGDFVYAGRKRSREDRKWAKRIMLEAVRLEFNHPVTKVNYKFELNDPMISTVRQYLEIAKK